MMERLNDSFRAPRQKTPKQPAMTPSKPQEGQQRWENWHSKKFTPDVAVQWGADMLYPINTGYGYIGRVYFNSEEIRDRIIADHENALRADALEKAYAKKLCKWHNYRLNKKGTDHIVDGFPMPCRALADPLLTPKAAGGA